MAFVRRITLLTNPDVCNLSCPLCFLNQRGTSFAEISGFSGEMNFDVAKAAVEKFGSIRDEKGLPVLREVIPSTMGEPLLYSRFEELLSLCSSLGIPMNLTTNGTFPGIWKEDANLSVLLQNCSDIKISSLASECFSEWKKNVERLVELRRQMVPEKTASISIQATLHKKNLMMIPELIAWATAIGIERIKWNSVVFLSLAKDDLRAEYGLDRDAEELKEYILNCSKMCGSSVRHEGSLFAVPPKFHGNLDEGNCPFGEELWILPDGTEQRCPNPERRFGNKNSAAARCCFLKTTSY